LLPAAVRAKLKGPPPGDIIMQPTRHARAPALAVAVAAATLTLAAPARAQTYDPDFPVCLQVYQGFVDYYFECRYYTMAQCQMSASGRSASCVVNPYYKGRGAAGPRRKKPRHY
jgi:Protein of unknown function (DUF3551)